MQVAWPDARGSLCPVPGTQVAGTFVGTPRTWALS